MDEMKKKCSKNKKIENRNNKNKSLKRFAFLTFKKNKGKLLLSFIMVIIVAVVDLVQPQVTRMIVDEGIGTKDANLLLKLMFIYGAAGVSSAILYLLLSYLYSAIKKNVTVDIKIKLLNHLSKLSGKYYSNIKTGNIISIIESDIFIIENFGAELAFSILVNIFTASMALFFLVRMQVDLFLIVLILQIILSIFQNKFTKLISKNTREIREDSGSLSNKIQEYVSNIKNVVVSKSRMKFFSSYLSEEKNLIRKYLKLDLIMNGNIAIAKSISILVTVSIYGVGGYKIISGNMTIGELLAFQQYTNMFIGPCISIVRANTRIQQAKASLDRVYSVIDEEIDIKVNNRGLRIEDKECNIIEFKNIYFSYKEIGKKKLQNLEQDEQIDCTYEDIETDSYILSNINITFRKGETTALIGESGSGKSTIVNLLYRLWDIQKGEITIDGINIKNINLKSLRKSINIVTQDMLMFDDTIRNNININKSLSDEELKNICSVVGMNDFISRLENGFDTIIGEKGVKISGGQKQRIALARSLVNDSKILILDEATSALDNISQSEILRNIRAYVKGKIVIIIAHRLSTIKDADNIYVLEKGKVVESGKDKELFIRNGIYRKLVTLNTQ
ncbi:TPA: ABC transporter ATP-binding protein [Clostridioides difficile]|uniref:ABC transporter ATP-binding protein n=10 Tax=Clostridioides difficile TaxID=1496 RepID=A0A9P3U0U5_CLODI|nr:ABC transporter ATP-binding protein [Clostridioides difficile]EHJ31810.1 ABC transporter, ATP-binding protein [Clostridioides difficile 002-P50-2011]EHJ33624.1 ABC transporter, ATP-binding protein [Clostridioides difficile 050-P50-2011]EQG23439.1 ABC transporter family protein [Clostridioides difficile DA00065]EQK25481.1 ABC transporter family protein [Clostridioides difficile P71]EQK35038.1 ABC transporter family protein [Clostridioides difficile P74]